MADIPPDDDHRRSRAGALAALAFAAVLVLVGLWIAQGLIGMAKQQNCVMSGRRDCLDAGR